MNVSNILLRVIGFGILITVTISGTIYKIFGIGLEFWIAVAVCVLLTGWAYVLYRKYFSIVICPKCRYHTTYQAIRASGRCPQCSATIKIDDTHHQPIK
jgi:hypothetical protein